MNDKYPIVSKVISTTDNVDVSMENVIPDNNQNYIKIPLTICVVPHEERVFLHFSGMSGTHIEVEEQSANGLYIKFVK